MEQGRIRPNERTRISHQACGSCKVRWRTGVATFGQAFAKPCYHRHPAYTSELNPHGSLRMTTAEQKMPKGDSREARPSFRWDDPLRFDDQLTEDERLIRDTPPGKAQDELA